VFNIFKRNKNNKPRVFLGTLAVVPRKDLKRYLELPGLFQTDDLDMELRKYLTEIFTLPLADNVENQSATDLVIDVIVTKFQSGEAWGIDLIDLGFPLMWRPKVQVSTRLYYLTTNKTKETFSVTQKLSWRDYFSRVFSWRGVFRFSPLFDKEDI
jgi:hypothetical protein